ncbi:MAG: efflux RND transporter periplasmic adaptor subunit [Roseiarcus sp.]
MLTHKLCSSTSVGGRVFRAACVVAATAALAGCNGSQNAYAPPPPPKVAVAQPLQKPVTLYLNLTGNTAPFNSVDLVARVQGFLTDIDYTDGAAAKAGDKLFGIERDQYQAQLDQANATLASNQATLAYNQAEYQRQATLGKQDFASQATVQEWKSKADEAAAQVLNAKAAIETAQINLNYTTVTAPFDGVVTRHLVDRGALVGVGSPTKLATIIQLDPLYVYFTISEPQILRIKVNNAKAGIEFRTTDLSKIPVEIGLQGEEGFPHLGRMDYAAPQVDQSTGTLEVRAIFDNKARGLLPGLFVRVRTPVEKLDKAILVPDVALGTSQEGRYLLVVGQDNVVQRKIVKTGEREGAYRIIESGIAPGDWVVTEGVQRALPGAKVTPQHTKLDEAAADQDSARAATSEPPKPAAPELAKPAATGPAK